MVIIENVSDFKVNSDSLITMHGKMTSRRLQIWNNIHNYCTEIFDNRIIPTIKFQDIDNVWIYTPQKTFNYCISKDKISKSYEHFVPQVDIDGVLIGHHLEDDDNKISAIDEVTGSTLWKTKYKNSGFISQNLNNEFIFINSDEEMKRDKLISINVKSGTENWIYSLDKTQSLHNNLNHASTLAFVKIICEENDIIWIAINTGSLYGISRKNGALLYSFPQSSTKGKDKDVEPYSSFGQQTIYDKNRKIIVSPNGKFCSLVNLSQSSPFITIKEIDYASYTTVFLNKTAGIFNDNIFFFEGGDSNLYGIYNFINNKIISLKTIEIVKDKFPAIRKMDVSNGIIYILDHFYSLHIYYDSKENHIS